MRRLLLSIMIGLLAATAGCQSHSKAKVEAPIPAVIEFEKRLAENGSVTFRSWNGRAHRMNSDTELVFLPDHMVQMLQWGVALTHYFGTYQVEPDGRITTAFEDLQAKFPVTFLNTDGGSLTLLPIDPDEGFFPGERGAVAIPNTTAGFWPFRMLTGDAERQVLGNMKPHQ